MLFLILGIVSIIIGIIITIFAVLAIIGVANNINGFISNYGWRVGLTAKNIFTFVIGLLFVAGGIALLLLM